MKTSLPGAWRLYGRSAAFGLAVLLLVGTFGHLHPRSLPWMLKLTPWFLLLSGGLVVAPAAAVGGRRFLAWVAATYVFTFLAEAAGVATGAVFGAYAYGPTLGWAWLGVPLVIAFNWVMVIHGCYGLARRAVPRRLGRLRRPGYLGLTALLATGFDVLLEPVAIRLDYWQWAGGDIPLQNYAAWFLIALLAAGFHPRDMSPSGDMGSAGRLGALFVGLQAMFFLTLQLVWHYSGT
ncbi:MAG: carotenoid biosynthesis protein [Lentisphaerae bacterium]|nr:carotenoid biosynthesis protein [Lentisphaerota bacterium]